jgi:hypothetical protein
MVNAEPPHEFYELIVMAQRGQLQRHLAVYTGIRTQKGTYVEHMSPTRGMTLFEPGPSQAVDNRSPVFEWGYGGSGPAQLAIAILLDFTGSEKLAVKCFHDYKWQVIAKLGDRWTITGPEVMAWLNSKGITEDDLAAM